MGKQKKRTMWIVFIAYLVLLTWAVLLKFNFGLPDPIGRTAIWIPYYRPTMFSMGINLLEILINIIAFVPFGVFCGMLFPRWTFWKRCLPFIAATVVFEVLQYVFAIGVFDTSDLINNVLGGIIGLQAFAQYQNMFEKQ